MSYPDWISQKKKNTKTIIENTKVEPLVNDEKEEVAAKHQNTFTLSKKETLELYQKIKDRYKIGEEVQLNDGYYGNIVHFYEDTVEVIIKKDGVLKNKKVSYVDILKVAEYKSNLENLINETEGEIQKYLKDLFVLRGFYK